MFCSMRCRVFRPRPDTPTTVGTVLSGSIVSMFDSVPDSPDLDAYAKLKITSLKLSWYWGSRLTLVCDARQKQTGPVVGPPLLPLLCPGPRRGIKPTLGHVDRSGNAQVR
jgi:hypothetical protein